MLIESRPLTDPEVAALATAGQRELREAVGEAAGRDFGTRGDTCWLTVVIAGRAVACGGMRVCDDDTGELEQLYVRPAYRRRGIARQLVAALEELAYQRGYSMVRVEAGPHRPAAALFRACGYEPISAAGAPSGGAPYRECFAKRLPVPA
ncbi:GNAT family N-acetyltransferase [Verrucosispora sioxanthis]|uniref:GNAT family N-acetyltransferase n=1 Tax=Verrucosispora sioxanthis TaxID=2499994 RepID=A0A6M1LBF7_9ACTN|nr:GNAT family N-acetyltransferase [Verrucosispora sioxanthis]NEE66417.1 GNAT family N-acetyltransferase [Verrucosispora sioxanthis]NGM15527.1 GNAT family N-acetyltransferase [Verrucosispora sioxanthis]